MSENNHVSPLLAIFFVLSGAGILALMIVSFICSAVMGLSS